MRAYRLPAISRCVATPLAIVLAAAALVALFPGRFLDPLVLGAFLLVAVAAFSEGLMHARREDAKERRADAALRESEERFRRLSDNSPVMMWITDTSLSPTYISQSWLEFTGMSYDEVVREPVRALRDTLHPDDLPAASAALAVALQRQDRFSHEYRLRRHDGSYRWVLDSGVPRFTADGEYVGFTGVIIDIDDRKQAEAALRTSEQRLRMLVENVPVVQAVIDPTGRFLIAEGRGLERFDLRDFDPHGRHIDEVYEGYPSIIEGVQRALNGETGDDVVEFQGAWWDVHYTPIHDADGRIAGATVVGLDVNEREHAKAAIEESEMRYRLIARATIDAIWDLDLATGHVWCSDGFTTRFGYPAELVGHDMLWWAERVHPEDVERALAERDEFLASSDTRQRTEYRFLRADGTYARVVGRIYAVRDEAGHATRLVGSLTDVTEQRQLEQQFLHAQKMETVGRLAGGIAHDFSNLMTAIMVNAELDLASPPAPDTLREDLEEIKATAERAAGLSKQLLSFARRQIVEPRVISICDLVRSTERMLQRLIGANITFRIEHADEITTVRIDPGQMEQVLVNMVVNARDAMPDGGELTIRVGRASLTQGSTGTPGPIEPGDYVLVEVRDTGAGMNEEIREHAFEPFFTTKSIGGGTGLGLSTSYGIVKQAGGHIFVESEVGRGSAFRIYLPFVAEAIEKELLSSPSPELPRGNETILLVEEESAVRRSASRVLRELGYTVIEAADGDEGLAAGRAASPPIALVIADVVMPGLGGRDLVVALAVTHPDVRALLLSAYTDDGAVRDGIATNMAHCIAKPFSPATLAYKVREVLDGTPSARESATSAR